MTISKVTKYATKKNDTIKMINVPKVTFKFNVISTTETWKACDGTYWKEKRINSPDFKTKQKDTEIKEPAQPSIKTPNKTLWKQWNIPRIESKPMRVACVEKKKEYNWAVIKE